MMVHAASVSSDTQLWVMSITQPCISAAGRAAFSCGIQDGPERLSQTVNRAIIVTLGMHARIGGFTLRPLSRDASTDILLHIDEMSTLRDARAC